MTSQRASSGRDEVEVWRTIASSWKRLQRAAEKNLTRADLTVAEFRILRALKDDGPVAMNKLCPQTMLSQPTITGIVDKLEGLRFVERVRNPEDRREVLLGMTPRGREAFSRAEQVHRAFVGKSLAALRPEEVEKLAALLGRLADASDSMTEQV